MPPKGTLCWRQSWVISNLVSKLWKRPSLRLAPSCWGFQSLREARLDSEPDDGGIGPLHYATPEAAEKARMLHTIKRLGFNPALSYAEPNFITHALLIPNDPDYVDQLINCITR